MASHAVCVARPEGLEPSTPGLEGRCSIQLSYGRKLRVIVYFNFPTVCGSGRGRGIRTPDPLLPKQMRYQTAPCPELASGQAGGANDTERPQRSPVIPRDPPARFRPAAKSLCGLAYLPG